MFTFLRIKVSGCFIELIIECRVCIVDHTGCHYKALTSQFPEHGVSRCANVALDFYLKVKLVLKVYLFSLAVHWGNCLFNIVYNSRCCWTLKWQIKCISRHKSQLWRCCLVLSPCYRMTSRGFVWYFLLIWHKQCSLPSWTWRCFITSECYFGESQVLLLVTRWTHPSELRMV